MNHWKISVQTTYNKGLFRSKSGLDDTIKSSGNLLKKGLAGQTKG